MPANASDGAMPLTAREQLIPDIPVNNGQQDVIAEIPAVVTSHWQRTFHDEVVVSGMSCRLPESDNVNEFRDHLMNNDDMVTEDDRRWTPGVYGLPARAGKIKDLSKFDATFFGVHAQQAAKTDPQVRMLLEVTFEAIVDAGINPETLKGSNTGVFVGASASEAADFWSANAAITKGFTMIGCQRGMFSNRLSYFFDFKGPSFTIDTACSSSLLAMDQALLAIRTGQCDAAVVAGSNLCIKPATAVQFNNLTMLSPDGSCKSFDESGNGYVRSEGIIAMFLQKHKDSKRIYAQLIHSKTNSDGAKEDGKSITFPSGQVQKSLITKTYEECGVHPSNVVYVEAHGTGTKAGDPEEVNSITEVFCKGRQLPLLIGSTKSNMGHPEPASGLAALTKVLISSEEQMLPANLHYNEPNPNIPGLLDGRLKVVATNTPWAGGLVAINSFGFGGTNVHSVINTSVAKYKPNRAVNTAKQARLLTYCGRTEESLQSMFDNIRTNHSDDLDLHALLSQSASQSYLRQPYRGYTLLNHADDTKSEIQKCASDKRELWYVFTGMGCQWFGMAKELMQLDKFAQSILRSKSYLLEFNIDLFNILMSDDASAFSNTINSFVSIAAIQVALVDVLSAMGLSPDGILGHSVGELGCGYADGSLTARETILAAYWRGRCIVEAKLEPGAMAAVGLTWQEAKEKCPTGVVPACHNAEDTVTISGPADAVREFVVQLKGEGYFAKEVSSNGVAFHSYYMSAIAPRLKESLSKVIKPKRRGARWISTSIPESSWDSELHSYSSADYHVNNLVSSVLFQEGLAHIPSNAVTVEIAPHALLQSILKRSLNTEVLNIGLQKRGHEDNLGLFYQSVGKLYQAGFNPDVMSLYEGEVSYPVPRGTPSVSSLVRWDHSATYDVPTGADFDLQAGNSGRVGYDISLNNSSDNENKYLVGHKIDGRILYPATGYLVLAWKTFAMSMGKEHKQLPVMFDDVKIHEATILQSEGTVTIYVSLLSATGAFEVIEDGKVKASGKISTVEDNEEILLAIPPMMCEEGTECVDMNSEDLYKDLRLRGYEYEGQFKGIVKAQTNGDKGVVKWEEDWISFLDTMLQITILQSDDSSLRLPTRIGSVRIDPNEHANSVFADGDNSALVKVTSNSFMKLIETGGVQIFGLQVTTAPRRKNQKPAILETYEFVANERIVAAKPDFQDYLDCCSFAAYSSLKCIGDNVKALRIPSAVITQLADMHKNNRNLDAMLDLFPKDQKHALLDHLRNLSAGYNDPHADPMNMQHDTLLNAIHSPRYYKPAVDIVFENCGTKKLKLTELISSGGSAWYTRVLDSYESQPLVKVDYTVWTTSESDEIKHDDPRIEVKSSDFDVNNLPVGEQHLVLLSHVLEIPNGVQMAWEMLTSGGFLLTVEYNVEFDTVEGKLSPEFSLVYKVQNALQTVSLWRRKTEPGDEETVNVSGFGTDWVEPLKERLAALGSAEPNSKLWVVANEPNGAVGLMNCLRQEEFGDRIRCVFNAGSGKLPVFDSEEMKKQKEKDLVMNVYSNGSWGSYRHLPLLETREVSTKYAYVNVIPAGSGLSNLRWIESPMKYYKSEGASRLCRVSYAALNFRDVMLATGKLSPEAIPGYQKMQDCLLGMEFSGYCGVEDRRVMGLCSAQALATAVDADQRFLWDVPSGWTMSEAATVPVVYATAYYALMVRGRLQANETVLIHSGSGGVGQAAISIALSLGCKVIATVGTQAKKNFLLDRFPALRSENILDSRSSLFEFEIMKLTRGRGVHVVLNSLAEEKLQASVRVLSQHGRFLEIGKFDLANNSALGMSMFLKNTSFHGILLDSLFDEGNVEWEIVKELVSNGIKSGVVQPLSFTSFGKRELEEAFRFMSTGKHIGKVLIEVNTTPDHSLELTDAIPKFICSPAKSYLITGGLGGFGLQLAQWLVTRGAKKLILTSRSGISNGYQAKVLDRLRVAGIDVRVSKRNAACYSEAKLLIQECMSMAPIGGLFNLAMVLRDAMIENQMEATFKAVFEPKVTGTLNLDSLTRELCSHSLEQFVVFSSISGGRGNAGQANYGFANTAMERMCEKRQADGFPGLAIQWGAIGDVGVVISSLGDNDTEVGGTLPQRIGSCLSVMDTFLCKSSFPVLSSFVVADKHTAASAETKKDIVTSVFNILGVSDMTSVSNDSSLGSLGLDSLMAVEVKQLLEREYDLNFSMKQIRALTITSLREAYSKNSANESMSNSPAADNKSSGSDVKADSKVSPDATVVLESVSESDTLLPADSLTTMCTSETSSLTMFMIHPIEGHVKHLRQLAIDTGANVYGLQCNSEAPLTSINELATYYIQLMKATANGGRYNIVGYSFGATVAFEMALQLQSGGEEFSLILLDGSHCYVKMFTSIYDSHLTEEQKQLAAFSSFLEQSLHMDNYLQINGALLKASTLDERLTILSEFVSTNPDYKYTEADIQAAALSYYHKLVAADSYTPDDTLKQALLLIKAQQSTTAAVDEHYGLTSVCDDVITTSSAGNHVDFVTDENSLKVANAIKQWFE